MPITEQRVLYGAKEAAEMLSFVWVRSRLRRNAEWAGLAFVQYGTRRLIPAESLDAFVGELSRSRTSSSQ